MIRFALALVVGGAFLTFYGFNENKLASAADTEPQTIAAADLIANGPGENAHVIVTDLYILDSYAYEGPDDGSDKYDKLWVPRSRWTTPGRSISRRRFKKPSRPTRPTPTSPRSSRSPTPRTSAW